MSKEPKEDRVQRIQIDPRMINVLQDSFSTKYKPMRMKEEMLERVMKPVVRVIVMKPTRIVLTMQILPYFLCRMTPRAYENIST